MTNKKRILFRVLFFLGIIFLSICLIFIIILFNFKGLTGKIDYNKAKSNSIELFKKEYKDFVSVKNGIITNKSTSNFSIKGVRSISYNHSNFRTKVEFILGNQGMTGGQHWGVYFVSNDTPSIFDSYYPDAQLSKGPYSGSYYYSNFNNHNFYATEKIENCWYFFYMDFDGNKHNLDWK